MWLSLIRIASSRPKRWLKPPPQRTAYFSSARRPGVVLRVQQMRSLVCRRRGGQNRRSRRDAGEPAEEIQRHALAGQHGAGRARDRQQRHAGGDARAVAVVGRGCRRPATSLRKRRSRERQAGDHAGLARHHDGAGRRVLRDRRDRGDVAGAAEILVERARTASSITSGDRKASGCNSEAGVVTMRVSRLRRSSAAATARPRARRAMPRCPAPRQRRHGAVRQLRVCSAG